MIEVFYIQYLAEALGVPAFGDVPDLGTSTEFVTVEKTGSGLENHIDRATIAVQSWSSSRAAAAALNERVKSAMLASPARPEISRCGLNSDYNFPDLVRKRPRYQAVFEVVYFN